MGALLDDAENLLTVLLAAMADEDDSRALQVETVLRIAREKLNGVHDRMERQDARYRTLFSAYVERKLRAEKRGG